MTIKVIIAYLTTFILSHTPPIHFVKWLVPASLFVAVLILTPRFFVEKQKHENTLNAAPPSDEAVALDQYLYDRCCRFMMSRRPFLVDSFSLQDLANAVYTNKVYLSKTINRFSGKNFRQYVNFYRVMYAMELFRGNMGLRISELTELSGFRSTTVFLRNFKQVMGEQPSHWCARVRRMSSIN